MKHRNCQLNGNLVLHSLLYICDQCSLHGGLLNESNGSADIGFDVVLYQTPEDEQNK
jgi:hypothetical protein